MKASALALLGAGALALGASTPSYAAGPAPGPAPIYVFVPVPMDFFAPPMGFERLFAAQEAAMTRLIAEMSRLPALPFPALPTEAAPGTHLFVTSVSSTGNGACSEVITETFGRDGKPTVTVKRSGDACGALPDTIAASPAVPVARPMPVPLQRVRYLTPATSGRGHAFDG